MWMRLHEILGRGADRRRLLGRGGDRGRLLGSDVEVCCILWRGRQRDARSDAHPLTCTCTATCSKRRRASTAGMLVGRASGSPPARPAEVASRGRQLVKTAHAVLLSCAEAPACWALPFPPMPAYRTCLGVARIECVLQPLAVPEQRQPPPAAARACPCQPLAVAAHVQQKLAARREAIGARKGWASQPLHRQAMIGVERGRMGREH